MQNTHDLLVGTLSIGIPSKKRPLRHIDMYSGFGANNCMACETIQFHAALLFRRTSTSVLNHSTLH